MEKKKSLDQGEGACRKKKKDSRTGRRKFRRVFHGESSRHAAYRDPKRKEPRLKEGPCLGLPLLRIRGPSALRKLDQEIKREENGQVPISLSKKNPPQNPPKPPPPERPKKPQNRPCMREGPLTSRPYRRDT